MKFVTGLFALALLAPASALATAPSSCPMVLDFDTDANGNAIAAGQDLWLAYGAWGIDLTTWNSIDMSSVGMGIAFDSSNPTGGDDDLGTPNEDFGGPGVGVGGSSGAPGENSLSLGNLLISSENFVDANGDGLIDVPDDDAGGAWFEFNFDQPTCVFGVQLVDIEASEGPSDIIHYGPSGDTLMHVQPGGLGNNSVDTFSYEVCGVSWMLVDIYGSGGVNDLSVCVGGTPEVCDGLDNDGDGEVDEDFDGDGDGFACGNDCDDTNPNAYPGAPEWCDGIDTDCDGNPDNGFDDDGDGVATCFGDCDDNDPNTYPGAPELCDGIDNDCDGILPSMEVDGDGDGFSLCDSDCDDTNDSVYPGAPELCDGIDTDCDGLSDEDFDADSDGIADCIDSCPMLVDFDTDPWGESLAVGDDVGDAYQSWGMTIQQFTDPNLVIDEPVVTSAGPDGAGIEAGPGNTWWQIWFTSSTCVHSVSFYDIDTNELPAQVILFDVNVQQIAVIDSLPLGNETSQVVDLGGICGVYVVMIDFYGDGGWDNLDVCVDPNGTEEVCDDSIDNDGDGHVDEDCDTGDDDDEGEPEDEDEDEEDEEEDEGDCSYGGRATVTAPALAAFLLVLGGVRRRRAGVL